MKTRRRAYSELTNELAALPKDNIFTGVNSFQKSQSDGTKLSKIEVNPDLTNPLISITKKIDSSGIVVTDSTKINPDSIIIENNVINEIISITHSGFKVDQSNVYTEYNMGSISHNTTSSNKQTLTFPNKSGVLAITSDIDVTAAGNNKFTGSNTFTKIVTFGDINASTGTAISTYGVIQFYNGAFSCGQLATGYYDDLFKLVYKNGDEVVKFPHGRSGTFALTSDVKTYYKHNLIISQGTTESDRVSIYCQIISKNALQVTNLSTLQSLLDSRDFIPAAGTCYAWSDTDTITISGINRDGVIAHAMRGKYSDKLDYEASWVSINNRKALTWNDDVMAL